MTLGIEVLVAPLVSALLVGVASYVSTREALAKITARMDAQEERQQERHESNNERMKDFEKAVGLSNGGAGGYFMSRRECALLDATVGARMDSIKIEVHQVKQVVDDVQRRVVHLERESRRDGGNA